MGVFVVGQKLVFRWSSAKRRLLEERRKCFLREFQKLADETQFTVEEVKLLHTEFCRQLNNGRSAHVVDTTSAAQPSKLRSGLSYLYRHQHKQHHQQSSSSSSAATHSVLDRRLPPVNWLQLFGLSEAVMHTFAERFICLFWRQRVHLGNAELKFEDFVKTFSLWTRGSINDRLTLLFRLYDANLKGYVVAGDIANVLGSIFHFYHKRGMFEWTTEQFQASVTLEDLSAQSLSSELEVVCSRMAEAAIDKHHKSDDCKRLLWFGEFCEWAISLEGVAENLFSD